MSTGIGNYNFPVVNAFNAENNEECLNKTINWSFDDNGVPLEFENVNLPSLNKETVYLKESKCHVKDEAFMLDYSV
jgi:hypothetical protein